MAIPISGGTVQTLASQQGHAGAIAVDATSVYWFNTGGGLFSVPKTGGTVQTLDPVLPGSTLLDVAVDGTNVYATNGQQLTRTPVTGGTSTVLWNSTPTSVAVDATNYYWTDGLKVFQHQK